MGLGYKNNINAAVTAVSNTFIDEYMGTASGEYVKVYLYLLRHAGESVEIPDIAESFSEYEKCTAMLAGLLHDIGHGPFSHAFESVSSCRHETFTQRILLEDSEIHQVLADADPRLPQDIAAIIAYRHTNDLLNQLVVCTLVDLFNTLCQVLCFWL